MKVKILESVLNEIISTIGSRPAESGGLLFGYEDDMIVRKFVFDSDAKTTRSTYTFNTKFLNPEIKKIWEEDKMSCIGFIHSHPHGCGRLSAPDIEYFSSMFEFMPRKYYITPIVFSVPDGGFKMNTYILKKGSKTPKKADLEIFQDMPSKMETLNKGIQNFDRIKGAVSVDLMKKMHIIGVGAGGAYSLYDSLSRSAVGKLTVLDFDTVDEVNLSRQGYEPSQISKLKVDALGEHLQNVNSALDYNGIKKNFLDMDETEIDSIFGSGDLFLFLTDSFKAQAFGNKLALKYNKPAIWAGFYEKSQCAELVFYIPNVTPACFRCAVSPRYVMQKENGSEIRISSNCNTIFHSQLLDAFVGMLILAILHNDTKGFEFSNWFGKTWERNLFQMKIHPSYGTLPNSLFDRTFKGSEGRAVTFNSVWQAVEVEKPPKYELCPDCHGGKAH